MTSWDQTQLWLVLNWKFTAPTTWNDALLVNNQNSKNPSSVNNFLCKSTFFASDSKDKNTLLSKSLSIEIHHPIPSLKCNLEMFLLQLLRAPAVSGSLVWGHVGLSRTAARGVPGRWRVDGSEIRRGKPPQMYKILWILGYRSYINWWYGKRWQVLYKELLVWIKYIVYTECLETLRFEIELTWITYHPELLSRSNGVVSNSGSCRTRLNLNLYRKRPKCRWLILEYVAHSSILLEENAYLGNVLGYSVPLKDIDFAIVHNLSPKIK